ncbi:hypothetical protein [Cedecea colo]|uniref:hypothetical protein n=1 Tax=Cedecea colo TaxID=2552946 RepID=UPI0014318E2C|nr:hypothetical protein [Cedecea colo]
MVVGLIRMEVVTGQQKMAVLVPVAIVAMIGAVRLFWIELFQHIITTLMVAVLLQVVSGVALWVQEAVVTVGMDLGRGEESWVVKTTNDAEESTDYQSVLFRDPAELTVLLKSFIFQGRVS